MSSTLLAKEPGSESAAASAVSGLMLTCFGVILVHWFTLGLGDVTTIQTGLGAIVSIATQCSEVHTSLALLQWGVWWHPPTTGTLLGIPRRHARDLTCRFQPGQNLICFLIYFIVLSCPIQEVSQQSTGGLLTLTPYIVTRVLVHDFMVCQTLMLSKRELRVGPFRQGIGHGRSTRTSFACVGLPGIRCTNYREIIRCLRCLATSPGRGFVAHVAGVFSGLGGTNDHSQILTTRVIAEITQGHVACVALGLLALGCRLLRKLANRITCPMALATTSQALRSLLEFLQALDPVLN